jgi:thiamine-monophosphate kinase
MGEFELLARVRERLPAPGPRVRLGMGDDAAITVPGGATATSVDAIVEGVHFSREHCDAGTIGRKALAVALSDLAAMGAEPGEAYVVLGVPPGMGEEECMELIDGATALAAETGTTLAGGDVTRAPALTVAVTVVGHAADPERFVTRAGARPGEALVLTGEVGGAAAGLLLLERPELAAAVTPAIAERLRARQVAPRPQLGAGRALAAAGATAMIDLSDGIGGDALRLAEESGAGLRIDTSALPIADGVIEVAAAAGRNPLQLATSGGEDYELLAAVPPERLDEAAAAVGAAGAALARVGETMADSGVEIKLPDGRRLEAGGFDQLS